MTSPDESGPASRWEQRLLFGLGGGVLVCFAVVMVTIGQGTMCTTEPGNNSLDEPPCDVVNSAAWFAVFASAAVVIAAGIDRSLARHRWRYIALWLGIIVVSWVWASSW